jgi:hypothetical protein
MLKEGKQVKSFRDYEEIANQLQTIRENFSYKKTESFSFFKNADYGKQRLMKVGAFQLIQNEEPIGVMVDKKLFESLLEYVEVLESKLESENFEAMLESRKGDEDFATGDSLGIQATDLFFENEDEIRRFLNEDKS